MNNIWKELSEESREIIKQEYKDLQGSYVKERFEVVFGKQNLNSKPPIKTWEDYEKTLTKEELNSLKEAFGDICCLLNMKHGCNPISRKMIATFKIATLIEAAYGGMVTNKEWADPSKEKYVIIFNKGTLDTIKETYDLRDFIAFHTEKQRKEFFKYNKQLCKDYYMMSDTELPQI